MSRSAKALALVFLLPVAAIADPVTLLAFGDSLTQGYGLAPGDGFVPQLEAWLGDHGAEVTLVNAGVSGDTTAGGAARIDWSLSDEIDGVIVALGGNDLLRGVAPEVAHANLDSILAAITAKGLPVLLVGQIAPANYGPGYQAEFNALYPALAADYGVRLFTDFLAGLNELDDPGRVLGDYMQPDGLHPNAEGVALIVARMGPVVLDLVEDLEK